MTDWKQIPLAVERVILRYEAEEVRKNAENYAKQHGFAGSALACACMARFAADASNRLRAVAEHYDDKCKDW